MLACVFGGGNALGTYHGGVVEALGAAELSPDWVAGSSIGAVTAALVAGSKPERRVAAVREFWRRATSPDPGARLLPEAWRRPMHFASALQARIMGRPLIYNLRLAELLGGYGRPGLYDRTPMRRVLAELVDFERLNTGPMRVSILAVDVETGAEVPFDNRRDRIGIDHLLASAGLIPDYPAVEVDGRMLVDGGMASNTPVDLVLAEGATEPMSCFAADPFPLRAPRPRRLSDAAERQSDLMFGCQTVRTLRAMRQLWAARGEGPPGAVYSLNYAYQEGEVALKTYDFAQSSMDRRWRRGLEDMRAALAFWRANPPSGSGLAVHPINDAAAGHAANAR